MSTANNYTPLQLWVQGSLMTSEEGTNPTGVTDKYGIDWDGPIPLDDSSVDIPPTSPALTSEQLTQFEERTMALQESTLTEDKLKLYKLAKKYLHP